MNQSFFSFKEFISTNERKSVVVEVAKLEDLVHIKEYEQRLNNIKSFAKLNNSSYRVFILNTDGRTEINEKTTKWMRKLFSGHGRHIIFDESAQDDLEVLDNLYKNGYKRVTVFDSDLYESMIASNGKQRKNKRYFWFEATKHYSYQKDYYQQQKQSRESSLFQLLESNDFCRFRSKIPEGIRFNDAKRLYLFLREQYGFPEIAEIRNDVFFKTTPIREKFVKGTLFSVNDIVVNKNGSDQIHYTVTKLGSNYLVVTELNNTNNDTTTKKKKMWIEEAQKVNA